MEYVALLRGVMPSGKNSIPKMADLVKLLAENGFSNVRYYIQSGNILLERELLPEEISQSIHQIIYKNIGANLSVIVKSKSDLIIATQQNPFSEELDFSRIHLVFTNQAYSVEQCQKLNNIDFGDEKFAIGSACFYLYLPREAKKKKLNNNFLEKQLGIVATTRKLNVVNQLILRMA